jgi:hypothetical protein
MAIITLFFAIRWYAKYYTNNPVRTEDCKYRLCHESIKTDEAVRGIHHLVGMSIHPPKLASLLLTRKRFFPWLKVPPYF